MRPSNLQPGEKEAIKKVLEIARAYGYGNLIAHLKRAGGTYEKNLLATDTDAYPEAWDIDRL
jgi:hypothetical protein